MSNFKNDGPDSRDLRAFEKLEKEWDKKRELAEVAQKNLEDEFRKFFKENRGKLAKEALENINKPHGSNPFGRPGEGSFGGIMNDRDKLGDDQ